MVQGFMKLWLFVVSASPHLIALAMCRRPDGLPTLHLIMVSIDDGNDKCSWLNDSTPRLEFRAMPEMTNKANLQCFFIRVYGYAIDLYRRYPHQGPSSTYTLTSLIPLRLRLVSFSTSMPAFSTMFPIPTLPSNESVAGSDSGVVLNLQLSLTASAAMFVIAGSLTAAYRGGGLGEFWQTVSALRISCLQLVCSFFSSASEEYETDSTTNRGPDASMGEQRADTPPNIHTPSGIDEIGSNSA